MLASKSLDKKCIVHYKSSSIPYPLNDIALTLYQWLSTFKLCHDLPLKVNASSHDIILDVDAQKLQESWDVTEKAQANTFWEDVENWFTDRDPYFSFLQDVASGIIFKKRGEMSRLNPTFKFGKVGLGFFLTTNLLNPGAKVIKIDEEVGMRIPGNMLLVGHVIQGHDDVKSGRI